MPNVRGNMPAGLAEHNDPHFAEPECARARCGWCGEAFVSLVGVDEVRTIEDARAHVERLKDKHERDCEEAKRACCDPRDMEGPPHEE